MARPRLLDLFCGQGGAGEGYVKAGFDVIGVDVRARMAEYHRPGKFIAGDAFEVLASIGHEFDVIHASPPCQHYSSVTRPYNRDNHPDLIGPTRDALLSRGGTWVIENVVRAPLRDPVTVCGTAFHLTAWDPEIRRVLFLRRHRLFESPIPLVGTECKCAEFRASGYKCGGVYGDGPQREGRGYRPNGAVRADLMGIGWMSVGGLSQAIPPAYTQYIGRQIMARIRGT